MKTTQDMENCLPNDIKWKEKTQNLGLFTHNDHKLHTHTHSRIKAKGQAEKFRSDVRLERKTGFFLFKFPLMW